MTSLVVRRPTWAFDATTPYQWNPGNPQFGVVMNGLSFVAPAFERLIVSATRAAMELIDDPDVRAEADAFLRQEAVHARAHRNHTAALVGRYPGLQEVLDDLDARFGEVAAGPLAYQLAYVADIEATFTPMFDLVLRHRDVLFDGGDQRVAPLFLWHLVEEIEHRSSALVVYDAVVPSPWYRLRMVPRVFGHMRGCFDAYLRGVDAHVPIEDRGIDATALLGRTPLRRRRLPPQFPGVPRLELAGMVLRLLRSQVPGHSPATERTPPFADEWIAAFAEGRDVVRWYEVIQR